MHRKNIPHRHQFASTINRWYRRLQSAGEWKHVNYFIYNFLGLNQPIGRASTVLLCGWMMWKWSFVCVSWQEQIQQLQQVIIQMREASRSTQTMTTTTTRGQEFLVHDLQKRPSQQVAGLCFRYHRPVINACCCRWLGGSGCLRAGIGAAVWNAGVRVPVYVCD